MALWTPQDIISDVELWLDASDTGTITKSGDDVTQWDDKSGNNYDYTQTAGSAAPHSGTRTMNSLNVLDFDGSAQWLTLSSGYQGVGDAIVMMVIDTDTATASRMFSNRVGGNTRFTLYHVSSTQSRGNKNSSFLPTNVSIETGQKLLAMYADSTTLGVAYDGDTTYTTGGTAADVNTLDNWSIGANAGAGEFFDGAIAEIVYVKATYSLDTRQKLEGYLSHKWGLEGNLPSGHPYKTSAPETATSIDLAMTVIDTVRASLDATVSMSIELDMDVVDSVRNSLDASVEIISAIELDMTVIDTTRNSLDPDLSLSIEIDPTTINIARSVYDPELNFSIELDFDTIDTLRNSLDASIDILGADIDLDFDVINITRNTLDVTAEVVGGPINLDCDVVNITRNSLNVDLNIPLELDCDVVNITRNSLDVTIDISNNLDMTTLNINRNSLDAAILMSIELNFDTIDTTRNLLSLTATIQTDILPQFALDDIITFDDTDYRIIKIDPVYQANTTDIHHYEIYLR